MEELKKCPFCGGEINIIKKECLSNGFISYSLHHNMFDHANCILAGQSLDAVFGTEEQAIKAWNRRCCD